jgi:membrane protein DedA with SNARE-associated domain
MPDLESLTKSFVSNGGLWAYLTLFVTTFIEAFFPPIPSDVVVLFCALMLAQGELHWLPCLASSFAGGSLGALLVYRFGAVHGRSYFLGGPRLFVTPERFLAAEGHFKRYGNLILILNRALVGGRSFGFLVAGLMHHRLRDVLLYGLTGILAWYLLLFYLGVRFGVLATRLVNGLVVVVMSVMILSLVSLILSRLLFRQKPDGNI